MQLLRSAAVLLLVSISCFAQTFSKAEYAVGAEPRGIVAADFNGDGVIDLAIANVSANTVTLLLGRGDGSFNTGKTLGVAAGPTEVTTADLDNNGLQDIIVACNGAVSIFYMNANGSSTRFDFLLSGRVNSVTVGDFNRDSIPDIAAAVGGKVVVLLNHHDESFSVSATLSPEVPASVVRAADLNGDGITDIAIGACCQGSDVTYGAEFLAASNGDGTFSLTKITDQSDGTKLTVADVNGDGRADLILPYVGCHTPCHGIEIQTNNGNGNVTRFGGGGDSLFTGGPGQAVAADFNQDGRVEVGAPFGPGDYENPPTGKGYDKLIIWTVGSDGKFGTEADFALGVNVGAYSTVTADFNHDGKPDVAVVLQRTGKVAVLLNTTGNAGTHSDFELTLSFSPQTIAAGAKAQYQYQLEATNGTLPSIQLSCSGLPQGAACSFDSNRSGATDLGYVNIITTAHTSASLHMSSLLYLAMLPFGFVALPGMRRKKALLLILLVVGLLLLAVGCGGTGANGTRLTNGGAPPPTTGGATTGGSTNGSGGTPATGPTPSGTYQVTVIAKSADVTRTGSITLVVQ